MYNSKNTIINTLNSIKNQTNMNPILEVIVVNDGSSDNSLELVQNYKENNKNMPIIVINKPNGGVSTARNTGMNVANGDWIALLDSDDEWLKDKIEIQTKILKEHPEIDFLGGREYEHELKILWRRIDSLYKVNISDLCFKMFPQPSTAIFRKRIFEEIGGFDEKQRYSEDGNYFMKICSKFNYYYLPIQVVCYGGGRVFGTSGLSSNLKGMYKGSIKNIKELKRDSLISNSFYIFLRVFYWMKYVRRIAITNYAKTRKITNE